MAPKKAPQAVVAEPNPEDLVSGPNVLMLVRSIAHHRSSTVLIHRALCILQSASSW